MKGGWRGGQSEFSARDGFRLGFFRNRRAGGDGVAPAGAARGTSAEIYELSPFLPWTSGLAFPFPLLILLLSSFFFFSPV